MEKLKSSLLSKGVAVSRLSLSTSTYMSVCEADEETQPVNGVAMVPIFPSVWFL
jgi:hypothetical protein